MEKNLQNKSCKGCYFEQPEYKHAAKKCNFCSASMIAIVVIYSISTIVAMNYIYHLPQDALPGLPAQLQAWRIILPVPVTSSACITILFLLRSHYKIYFHRRNSFIEKKAPGQSDNIYIMKVHKSRC